MEPMVDGPEPGGAHRVLRGHAGVVTAAGFACNGRLLLTADENGTACAWKVPEFTHYFALAHKSEPVDRKLPIYSFAATDDGLVFYGRGTLVKQWETDDNFLVDYSTLKTFTLEEVHTQEVVPVLASARELVTGGYDGRLCIWREDSTLRIDVDSPVMAIACTPYAMIDPDNDPFYALGLGNGGLLLLADDEIIGGFQAHPRDVYACAWINPLVHQKLLLATSSPSDMRVRIWDKDEQVHEFEASGFAVAFSPDGRWLAYAHRDSLVIRDARTWQIAKVFNGHTSEIQAITFSPADPDELWNGWLVTAGHDGTARVWSLAELIDPPS